MTGRQPEKPKEPTPFEKFEQLAKRVVQAPKDRAQKPKGDKRQNS